VSYSYPFTCHFTSRRFLSSSCQSPARSPPAAGDVEAEMSDDIEKPAGGRSGPPPPGALRSPSPPRFRCVASENPPPCRAPGEGAYWGEEQGSGALGREDAPEKRTRGESGAGEGAVPCGRT